MPLYPNFSLHNSLTTLPYPPFSPHSPHSQYALHTCHFLYSTPFLLSTTLFTLFISSFLTLLVWRVEDGELSLNAVKECLSLFSIICAKIHFQSSRWRWPNFGPLPPHYWASSVSSWAPTCSRPSWPPWRPGGSSTSSSEYVSRWGSYRIWLPLVTSKFLLFSPKIH